MNRLLARFCMVLAGSLLGLSGCGSVVATNDVFPERLRGADGQVFFFEDLQDIAADTELTDEEKRQALRELGIEDPDLIDAFLGL